MSYSKCDWLRLNNVRDSELRGLGKGKEKKNIEVEFEDLWSKGCWLGWGNRESRFELFGVVEEGIGLSEEKRRKKRKKGWKEKEKGGKKRKS